MTSAMIPSANRCGAIYSSRGSHRGVDPVCRRVLGVFDGQLNDALSLQQTGAGAHGEAAHLLHAGDEEVHPAQHRHNSTQSVS